jgi:uncharacterized PurR-regulated membrane protein YhhQ (DUF165 family)
MTRLIIITAAFAMTVVCANLAIALLGPVPVGFGLYAPAGVYFAGVAFSLRDWLQEAGGRRWALGAILAGAALSALLSPQLAAASGLAFLFSELADFAVFTPLRRRSWLGAVAASNTVGAVVDSALFLWLAGFSLAFLPGQVLAKSYVTLATVALLVALRPRPREEARRG